MNKRDIIREVSERTGIALTDCEVVLNTFEDVFTNELENSRSKDGIFNTVYKVMNYIHSKRTNKE